MTKLVKVTAVCVSVLHANFATSQTIDGNTLYGACISPGDSIQQGFCIGYLLGQIEGSSIGAFMVLDQLGEHDSAAEVNPLIDMFLGRCVPNTATNQQLRDVVVRHLERHPETRHESARLLANLALSEAFPCPIE